MAFLSKWVFSFIELSQCVHLEFILFWFLIESDFDGFTLNLILKNFSDKQDCLALEFVNISNIFINILEIFSKR